ncbi:hypothetical protein AKJ64_03675 [candidate division MSBL1 archaeon SCGC-AAA259E17]|uniref:Uncharacterized protein n=1 Tax=candidate division MSBL1 archaeon SCGC-AAA259E17 TaxID=1698263 RepID=A0A133UDG3_9EURY|nr:hypothetical protein AKJ64_03675 [candidate division MSBL1 archaeon SCGC-AAA259E17]
MLQKLKENKNLLVFFLVFFLALYSADVIHTVQHESAHRQVCKKFGGENVTTYTNYSFGFTSGDTFCSNVSNRRGLELQMQADIVGYHIEALTMAFFLGIFVLVAYWELRGD